MSQSEDKVVWQSGFEIGLKEIDEQHHLLVDAINKANALLIKEYTLAHLQEVTQDLVKYALLHFETEEALMKTHHYDTKHPKEYAKHTHEHRQFKTKVDTIHQDLERGEAVEREEIINFLCQWLVEHTNKIDKRLGKFLESVA